MTENFYLKNIVDPIPDSAIQNALVTYNPVVSLVNNYLTKDGYGVLYEQVNSSPLQIYFTDAVIDNKLQGRTGAVSTTIDAYRAPPSSGYTYVQIQASGTYKISAGVFLYENINQTMLYAMIDDSTIVFLDVVNNASSTGNQYLQGSRIVNITELSTVKLMLLAETTNGTVKYGGYLTPSSTSYPTVTFSIERVG